MGKRPVKRRAQGPGYRKMIRELAAAGLAREEILAAMPGLRPSELELTLAVQPRRGRPPKTPSITTIEAVQRWRATQRPRTLRAAVECIDCLLGLLERQAGEPRAGQRRPLPGFS
jgi:hypothetical protein